VSFAVVLYSSTVPTAANSIRANAAHVWTQVCLLLVTLVAQSSACTPAWAVQWNPSSDCAPITSTPLATCNFVVEEADVMHESLVMGAAAGETAPSACMRVTAASPMSVMQ
jgi:hypothetical protein